MCFHVCAGVPELCPSTLEGYQVYYLAEVKFTKAAPPHAWLGKKGADPGGAT